MASSVNPIMPLTWNGGMLESLLFLPKILTVAAARSVRYIGPAKIENHQAKF
jgi:hypothetical protein